MSSAIMMIMFGFEGRSAARSCPNRHGDRTAATTSVRTNVRSDAPTIRVFISWYFVCYRLLTWHDGIALFVYSESFDDFVLPRFTPRWIRHLIFADGVIAAH